MRRTPMLRKTPMPRGTSALKRTPLNRGCSTLKRSSINPVSLRRRQDNAQRTIVTSAMRLLAEGRCARCGRTYQPVYGHERLGRAQGGSIVAPDCLLCNGCNGWAEDNPVAAAYTGWKVSGKHSHAPGLQVGQAIDLAGNLVTFYTETETP